ncbi:hypothetical protein SAMN05421821_103106 [Mucilaginibacter lappiensis]|uniref:Por secretion system C-terminal sorting domain-containing protein n=1 Tax=Mucilaginibacter lappiensis TaxID=354630 RepID=A0ABR6PGI6_9SPHI|nr:T9SS type A sorting domain-containing protein [Mucilaginibacter lappiensis]MBB6108872.1 hypothetical protein [Mucilaginibacter lappiensis]SIQ65882.1 hypothetical protein SAMN05421821_103106 [Mucilaginibacter lappiensis]
MKSLLHYLILLLILLGLQVTNVKAQVTHTWNGTNLSGTPAVYDWNDPTNWVPATVPQANDPVLINAALAVINAPTVTGTAQCASISFNALVALVNIPLTVNGILTVSGVIALQPTLLTGYNVPLSGTGTLNCGSIQVGSAAVLSSLLGVYDLRLSSTIANLNVTGGVTIYSLTLVLGLGRITGAFSLQNGTTTIGGQILTQYVTVLGAAGSSRFSIDPPTGSNAILNLTNAVPLTTTPTGGASYSGIIDFYNSTGTGQATVNYAYTGAGTQTVYSTTGFSNLDVSPALYQNLTFTGTGNKQPNISTGLLTVAGNIDNSASSPIDFVTNKNTVQLTGTTQTIAGGSYANTVLPASPIGTVFYNLTSTATTATLSGRNNIAALGTLAFLKTSNTTMNVDATATNSLTLLSNSTGDASIASLSADASATAITATVTGTLNVQRYVKGGGGSTGPRRYMLISSPVANASANAYNLLPFFATTYISGPGGAGNGFDTSPQNNPSVFIYDENAPLTTNPNVVTGNEFKGFATINETVPMGNGLEYYFRGSRTGVLSSAVFISPFPAPDNATLNFSGAVYKGAGTNGAFTASIINFPATPPTYYSSSAVTLSNNLSYASSASTKKGLNLVGNPYPSVIDLQKVYSGNSNAYRYYYMLVKNISTGANSFSTKYAVYDATNSGTPPAGASRYAVSGQGFFITAANATSTLTFNEGMKVPYSSYTSPASTSPVFNVIRNPSVVAKTLAVSPDKANNTQQVTAAAAPAAAQTNADPMPRLRLEMMKDTNILNTADIAFDKNSSAKFVPGEDAPYIAASGQGDFFYSQSADSVGCFANYIGNLEKLKRINLFIAFSNFGQYKITSPIKSNIDERYTIYLKDKYTNDSLDVVHNPVYTFNVDQNAASYPRDRFYLSIGIAPGHEYKLLGFSGSKVTGGIQLTWKTDNESNFTGFVVQKSTNGGKSFEVIDTLQSTGAGSYTFTDPAPGTGQITYRLAQSLVTGDTQLSKTLVFDYSGDLNVLKFMVYPTNTAQDIHIKLGKTYSNNIKINIISATGAMVKTLTTTDTDSVQENVGNLIKGLYIVEAIDATTGKRIGSAKFFKQ